MYYCEVTDDDKVTTGGGVDDEIIDVIELSLDEASAMVAQGASNNAPPSCLLGIMWFLKNRSGQANHWKRKILYPTCDSPQMKLSQKPIVFPSSQAIVDLKKKTLVLNSCYNLLWIIFNG